LAKPSCQTTTENEDSDQLSSDEEEKGAKRRCQKKKRCESKNGLPPRKALKKLVMKELEQLAPHIFETLIKCKELGQDFPKGNQSDLVAHTEVACDGCD
jgi:hypothetical protein